MLLSVAKKTQICEYADLWHPAEQVNHGAKASNHGAESGNHGADAGNHGADAGNHRADAGNHGADAGNYGANAGIHRAEAGNLRAVALFFPGDSRLGAALDRFEAVFIGGRSQNTSGRASGQIFADLLMGDSVVPNVGVRRCCAVVTVRRGPRNPNEEYHG